jgi:hypothetical protein
MEDHRDEIHAMTALTIDHPASRAGARRNADPGHAVRNAGVPVVAVAPFAHQAEAVALAVEETITTPSPGFGHGRLGDVAAVATFVLTNVFRVSSRFGGEAAPRSAGVSRGLRGRGISRKLRRI